MRVLTLVVLLFSSTAVLGSKEALDAASSMYEWNRYYSFDRYLGATPLDTLWNGLKSSEIETCPPESDSDGEGPRYPGDGVGNGFPTEEPTEWEFDWDDCDFRYVKDLINDFGFSEEDRGI